LNSQESLHLAQQKREIEEDKKRRFVGQTQLNFQQNQQGMLCEPSFFICSLANAIDHALFVQRQEEQQRREEQERVWIR
jgi:hypothetical protein